MSPQWSAADQSTLARLVERYGAEDVIRAVLDPRRKRRGRGRPKKPKSLSNGMLADTIDYFADVYREAGHRAPVRAAFEEAAKHEAEEKGKRTVPIKTIERYYRAGLRQNKDRDVRIAEWFAKLAGAKPSAATKRRALKAIARDLGKTIAAIERSVDRGGK